MLPRWIKILLRPEPVQTQGTDLSTLAPEGRLYAVGDIHGRLDLLQRLLAALDDAVPVVFLGDYVDRGDYSAQVLRHLRHLSTSRHGRAICLKGNHEEMLLSFLDNPAKFERVWMHNGGTQTLASFGLTSTLDLGPETKAEKLRHAMGEPLLEWLRERPLHWTSGNITAVHAAMDPTKPVEAQMPRTCLWGHPNFPAKARRDRQWVIHGHTIIDKPCVRGRVVSIDTGAFATNQLTAAEVSDGTIRFISTNRSGIVYSSA